MSKRHTPGPWWVEDCEGHPTIFSAVQPENTEKVRGLSNAQFFVLSKRENVVLAATAPELLVRLKVALDWIDELRAPVPDDVRQGIVDAIAKAEGRGNE